MHKDRVCIFASKQDTIVTRKSIYRPFDINGLTIESFILNYIWLSADPAMSLFRRQLINDNRIGVDKPITERAISLNPKVYPTFISEQRFLLTLHS